MCGVRWLWLTILLLASSAAASDHKIKVLTHQQAPYASVRGGLKQGFIIDLVVELFARAELEYELEFLPLKRVLMTTRANEDHCALPVVRSQERESQYKWISPVLVSRYGFFSDMNISIPLATLNDARPYVVGSFLGSGISEYLQEAGFSVEVASRSAQNIKMLRYQRIDLWAAEVHSAQLQMRRAGLGTYAPELVFFTSIRAMACNQSLSDDKLMKLQRSLSSMYQDGSMARLYRLYNLTF